MTLLQKIAAHKDAHQSCNLETCPFILTDKEFLKAYFDDDLLLSDVPKKQFVELILYGGFLGHVLGIDIYVFDECKRRRLNSHEL